MATTKGQTRKVPAPIKKVRKSMPPPTRVLPVEKRYRRIKDKNKIKELGDLEDGC
jgi:hypothetical protein